MVFLQDGQGLGLGVLGIAQSNITQMVGIIINIIEQGSIVLEHMLYIALSMWKKLQIVFHILKTIQIMRVCDRCSLCHRFAYFVTIGSIKISNFTLTTIKGDFFR